MPITTVYIYSQSKDDIIHWGRMAGLHESSRQLCIIEFVDLTVFCTNKELKRKEKCTIVLNILFSSRIFVYKSGLESLGTIQCIPLCTNRWKYVDI